MKTIFFNRYKRFSFIVAISYLSLLSVGSISSNTPGSVEFSTQLTIVMNDEACKHLIQQIKSLHAVLEKTLSLELNNNTQMLKVKNCLIDSCFSICSIKELMLLDAAKESFIKILLALCDASTELMEETLHITTQAQNNTKDSTITSFIKNIHDTSHKIKNLLLLAGNNIKPNSSSNLNNASLEKCYALVAHDVKKLLAIYPHVIINKKTFKFDDFDQCVNPYTQRIAHHAKKSFAKYLTQKDLDVLISFFESSAYAKLKNNSLTIVQNLLKLFSPEIKAKTESLLTQFWNQSEVAIATAAQKIKDCIVS